MNDRSESNPLTIGELARLTGVPVRTIRFWSDAGVLPAAGRSAGGYRLYDTQAVARLHLVRTLRDLGLDLPTVERVVTRRTGLTEVARTHVAVLDAEIRVLQARRAVMRSVAEGNCSAEEMRLMHELSRLSARERRRIVDDFVEEVFAGTDPAAPGAGIAQSMRGLPEELPDEPTVEQVEAWIELAGLVADPGFRERVRQMATGQAEPSVPHDSQAILTEAGRALDQGIDPESAEGGQIVDRVVGPGLSADERARLADTLERFTDRRVERYWQLLGVLNDRPPFAPAVPAFEWFIAALRAAR
ncbi:MerR family transcriptional regulator [Microbispora triticiradicis]|uniref:helix-turn-helix domain-containing protein n=1 Tax=Microbispora triticiradicis TaxID=2200763 RepID=UPI001AD6BE80|nr:MerR family transcriptional regulator [Microbispora triticiradicis]MBO4275825.1 MerR family transcriptional regulator [Microbispora triticiradicis]